MRRAIDWSGLAALSPQLEALPLASRRSARQLTLMPGQRLFLRGDRVVAMHFVRSGEVHLMRHAVDGTTVVLQRVSVGFLAEASLDQPRYHCDAIAARPSELIAIPRRRFAEALETETFRQRWTEHLARELRDARAQAERLSLKSAEQRIIHYVETVGSAGMVVLQGSRKDWARELGLTHEALYRTLARMMRAGLVRIDGRAIRLRARIGNPEPGS
jgi:CRP-like cAMP-binding protein